MSAKAHRPKSKVAGHPVYDLEAEMNPGGHCIMSRASFRGSLFPSQMNGGVFSTVILSLIKVITKISNHTFNKA